MCASRTYSAHTYIKPFFSSNFTMNRLSKNPKWMHLVINICIIAYGFFLSLSVFTIVITITIAWQMISCARMRLVTYFAATISAKSNSNNKRQYQQYKSTRLKIQKPVYLNCTRHTPYEMKWNYYRVLLFSALKESFSLGFTFPYPVLIATRRTYTFNLLR